MTKWAYFYLLIWSSSSHCFHCLLCHLILGPIRWRKQKFQLGMRIYFREGGGNDPFQSLLCLSPNCYLLVFYLWSLSIFRYVRRPLFSWFFLAIKLSFSCATGPGFWVNNSIHQQQPTLYSHLSHPTFSPSFVAVKDLYEAYERPRNATK